MPANAKHFDRESRNFSIFMLIVGSISFFVSFFVNAPPVKAEDIYIVPADGAMICTLDEGCKAPDGDKLDWDTRYILRGQPTLLGVARALMRERAEKVLGVIHQLTPEDLLTPSLARAAVRDVSEYRADFEGMSYGAREEMFSRFQCELFAYYPNPQGACWSARAFEVDSAEHAGVPTEIMPAMREMRQVLYTLGREYLKHPQNLRTTYSHVKLAMVDECRKLSYGDRTSLTENLKAGVKAVAQFSAPTVQEAIKTYFAAQSSWRASGDNTSSSEAYKAYSVAEDALEALVNREWALFLNRRHYEGGPELVLTYGEVIADFATVCAQQ